MQTSTFPANLQQLLAFTAKYKKPAFVILNCKQSGSEFLMQGVLDRLEKEFSDRFAFLSIGAPTSKFIKEELKTAKTPVILIVEAQEIRGIYVGMVPHQQLKKSLESYI